MPSPIIFLVGAGPGDPGLITCRGRDVLAECDCVVHDYLVNPEILDLAPDGAARHFVGKRGGAASCTQEEINALLIRLAGVHQRIVRLKGGDPFLFGRGGEEAAALAAAGVAFAVVPGVTSGIGVPAYAGIPVTHRAASSAVAFVTGHQQQRDDGQPPEPMDWASFAHIETLVLYMGMHRLDDNCAALIAHGRSGDTPACAIQWGTYPRQRVILGTLATLPTLAREARLRAPAITVIGDVVRYREHIRWFDHPVMRPLAGRRVLVTRAREPASDLSRLLRSAGAEVRELPLARYVPPASWAELDRGLDDDGHDWLAFTSANAVDFTWQRLRERGRDARALAGRRIAAVGPATATALGERGITPDLVPATATGTALAQALIAGGARRVLLPQADNARSELRDHLAAAGVAATTAIAYGSVDEPVPEGFDWSAIDLVPVASAATADRLVAAAGPALPRLVARARFYAIGPTTAAALAMHGLPVAAVAAEASVAGLVEAMETDLRRADAATPPHP